LDKLVTNQHLEMIAKEIGIHPWRTQITKASHFAVA